VYKLSAVLKSTVFIIVLIIIAGCGEKKTDYNIIVDLIKAGDTKNAVTSILALPDINIADKNGETLLHWAAVKGNKSLVEFLIDKGANIDAKNIDGITPLYWAALFDKPGAVYVLAHKRNANIYIRDYNKLHATPLHMAAYSQSVASIIYLLQKAKENPDSFDDYINSIDKNGQTPLMMGVWPYSAEVETLQKLLLFGANTDIQNENGDTALHIAISAPWSKDNSGRDAKYVKILLKGGANPNISNASGETPLHLASAAGNNVSIKTLLKYKADINAQDNNGWTPLHYASDNGRYASVKLLLAKKAKVLKDNKGQTYIDVAKDIRQLQKQKDAEKLYD